MTAETKELADKYAIDFLGNDEYVFNTEQLQLLLSEYAQTNTAPGMRWVDVKHRDELSWDNNSGRIWTWLDRGYKDMRICVWASEHDMKLKHDAELNFSDFEKIQLRYLDESPPTEEKLKTAADVWDAAVEYEAQHYFWSFDDKYEITAPNKEEYLKSLKK